MVSQGHLLRAAGAQPRGKSTILFHVGSWAKKLEDFYQKSLNYMLKVGEFDGMQIHNFIKVVLKNHKGNVA